MVPSRTTELYRQDAKAHGELLSVQDREQLIKPYLPSPKEPSTQLKRTQPLTDFLKNQLDLVLFTLLHFVFSAYIRLRQTRHAIIDRTFAILYYHHRAPELIRQDVKSLGKLPRHLSVIVELKGEEHGIVGLEQLMDDVAELSAWCCCAGIPTLSVYEKTGILKTYLPATQRAITKKLHAYFGRRIPALHLGAPHSSSSEDDLAFLEGPAPPVPLDRFSILLISAEDGRSTLVDLTRTLTEMSQRTKLAPDDISQDLIDAEITESVMPEPDLLILFTPNVQLQGYPPWQVRLTEIFHAPGSPGVGYQVFLRALHNFADAQMRFGR